MIYGADQAVILSQWVSHWGWKEPMQPWDIISTLDFILCCPGGCHFPTEIYFN